jgi:hypothetical protein
MQVTLRIAGICAVGIGAATLLSGCGGGGGGGGSSSSPAQPGPSITQTAVDGLVAKLAESSGTVSIGGSTTYTLTLTNNTGASVAINTTGTDPTVLSAGLVVQNQSDVDVYDPVPGTPPLDSGSLASGQSLTETVVVSAFANAGTYTATAAFENPIGGVTVTPLTVTAQ